MSFIRGYIPYDRITSQVDTQPLTVTSCSKLQFVNLALKLLFCLVTCYLSFVSKKMFVTSLFN